MPNTLCHIALQAPLNRPFCQDRDLLWVLIACIIPDIPWILLRLLLLTGLVDPFNLRLYASIQASLLFCLILSAALAQLGQQPGRMLVIMGLNCLFHLFLDATQVKWGNGVHFFLPMNWSAIQWQLFWPEHPWGIYITVFGLGYLFWLWPKVLAERIRPVSYQAFRLAFLACSLLLYFVGPLPFLQKLEDTDYYSIQTLRNRQERPGKAIAFDRIPYSHAEKNVTLFSGEQLSLSGELPQKSGTISLQGRFLSSTTVQVQSFHQHNGIRDRASLIGLFLTCTLLVQTLILSRPHFSLTSKGQTP